MTPGARKFCLGRIGRSLHVDVVLLGNGPVVEQRLFAIRRALCPFGLNLRLREIRLRRTGIRALNRRNGLTFADRVSRLDVHSEHSPAGGRKHTK